METLPSEILLSITNCLSQASIPSHDFSEKLTSIPDLSARDLTHLNLLSKRIYRLTRDNELWRHRCYIDSHSSAATAPTASEAIVPEAHARFRDLQHAVSQSLNLNNQRRAVSAENNGQTQKSLGSQARARWDASNSTEDIDWYAEYIARHGPIGIDWLPKPGHARSSRRRSRADDDCEDENEICGMALLDDTNTGNGKGKMLIAPISDGSIRLWDIDAHSEEYGREVSRSKQGLLQNDLQGIGSRLASWDGDGDSGYASVSPSRRLRMPNGVIESVAIDNTNKRGYFATETILHEIDLNTFQHINAQDYGQPISVLSECDASTPLTIGTPMAMHLHDTRARISCGSSAISMTEIGSPLGNLNDFDRLQTSDPEHAILAQPLPLAILHRDQNLIHVAGRFPSILNYDRRKFPRLASTTHSGARLSSMTLFPTRDTNGNTLAAVGEYNGKGSIELYPFVASSFASEGTQTRNRTTASSSKCLALTTHGTRLLFSDSNGMLKWVERDGSTLVRRWNVNSFAVSEAAPLQMGIFNGNVTEGDVARKLLTVEQSDPQSDVCIWSAEKLGILHMGKPREPCRNRDDSISEADQSPESPLDDISGEDEQRDYGRLMRRALQQQADEVRWVRGLGLDQPSP